MIEAVNIPQWAWEAGWNQCALEAAIGNVGFKHKSGARVLEFPRGWYIDRPGAVIEGPFSTAEFAMRLVSEVLEP